MKLKFVKFAAEKDKFGNNGQPKIILNILHAKFNGKEVSVEDLSREVEKHADWVSRQETERVIRFYIPKLKKLGNILTVEEPKEDKPKAEKTAEGKPADKVPAEKTPAKAA